MSKAQSSRASRRQVAIWKAGGKAPTPRSGARVSATRPSIDSARAGGADVTTGMIYIPVEGGHWRGSWHSLEMPTGAPEEHPRIRVRLFQETGASVTIA